MRKRLAFEDQLTAVTVDHENLTVHSKKIILIFLLVFYCVFFGENESITSQGIYIDRITSEKVIYNAVFLKISLYNKAENVNKTRKARKGLLFRINLDVFLITIII
jgi:hypothetical protein